MLDDLVRTIEALQERITKHRQYLGAYESRTRVALIDPLLTALGWDVSDPALVHIEPRTENGWADYALMGVYVPVAFVEAKKLLDTDAPITQTVGYAVSENIRSNTNVRYCIATNGDKWEVYDIMSQRSALKTSIASESAPKCALQLLGLWRQSLQGGSFDLPVEPLIEVEAAPVANQQQTSSAEPSIIRESVETTSPFNPPQSSQQTGAGWKSLADDFPMTKAPRPVAIRFPDGEEAAAGSWKAMLSATALWLYKEGRLTEANCGRASSSRRRFLLSLEGRHPDGQPFTAPFRLQGTRIVLETHFSAVGAVRHTRSLLEDFGVDPATVFLRFP